MNWKFWKKNDASTASATSRKLPKPKELTDEIGKYLVADSGYDPDWVWSLKSVVRPKDGSKTAFEIRIFEECASKENGTTIRDYDSLDDYPELIEFEGWFDNATRDIHLDRK